MAFAVDLRHEAVGKGVHAGDADSVESSGHFVAVLVELASGMEDGHHYLQCGTMLLRMHSGRDASSVVGDLDGIVGEDGHTDLGAIAGHRLIDTIVNNLINKMMESPLADVTDVHRRSFPHRLKPFQHLDATCGILFFRLLHLFVLNHILIVCFYQLYMVCP